MSSPSYPQISFKKCILHNHETTINQLTFHASKQALENPTIKRCLDMHYKDQRHKILTFLTTMVLVKIATKVTHMNRNLALSAPRNWRSIVFKYLFIPYVASTYKYIKDIRRTIMQIQSQIDQDIEADHIWQPIFQQKYPDLTKELYSSPFRKFAIEDVVKDNISSRKEIVG